MNRRNFTRSTLALLTLGLSPAQRLLASQLFSSAGQFTEIRNGIGFYTERGGTIGWMMRPGATVVVDTQFPESAANFLSGLREKQSVEKLNLLANTHHHGDHTGGNPVFRDLVETHVAHATARINQENTAKERGELNNILLPATTYTNEWSQVVGEETITLRHFGPAHTGGDSVVHFENANVAHLGDLLFNRRFPYIDTKAGGTFRNWVKVLKKIRKTYDKDTVFLFGHAAASYPVFGTRNDVAAMENYVKRLLQYVGKAKKAGKSLEQLKESTQVIPGAEEWRYGERLRDINLQVAWDEV